MRRLWEQALQWICVELGRQLQQRDPAAIAVKSRAKLTEELKTIAALRQADALLSLPSIYDGRRERLVPARATSRAHGCPRGFVDYVHGQRDAGRVP